MRAKIGSYAREIAFFAVLGTLAFLLFVYWDSVRQILSRHALAALYAGSISAIAITVQALNFLRLLEAPHKPALRATVHMWAMANLTNYLGPLQPGLAVRLAFFKRHGISMAATTTTTLRQIHLSTWTATGLAAAGLFSNVPVIRAIGAAGLLIFFLWPYVLLLLREHLSAWAGRWKIVSARREQLATLLSTVPISRLDLFVAQYVLIACSLYGVYWAFHAPLAPHEALLLAVASALSTLISITPNNLGVQEALFGYVAHLGGLSTSEALSVALLFRVAHIGACLTLLLLTLGRRSTNS